jgi:hypothetical protein
MATHAIEPDQDLPAPIEARGLPQLGAMAGTAGSLDVLDGQDGLLPGESGLVGVTDFRCQALAAMANNASPIADLVRYGWMGPERIRHGGILQAGFGDALMAGGTTIHNIHFRDPDLADFESEIC